MTTIGFIGAGNIGSTVARLAVDAGYDVLLSNRRGPDTLAELVEDLGPLASAVTPSEAASAADLVVVTIPLGNIDDLPFDALAGKTVIDTNNYYPGRDGQIEELDTGETTTSELLQHRLPNSSVVKAFNNIVFRHLAELARPVGAPDRSTLPIAGDSAQAKAEATAFINAIGYDVLDTGALGDSGRFERDKPAYVLPYAADREDAFGGGAVPASRDKVAELVAQG